MREIECRVCGERAHGVHFGVTACRACAAFFRRSVALKMNYVSARCMCRCCRFKKCVHLGMNADGVQLNRDFIGTTKKPAPSHKSKVKTVSTASASSDASSLLPSTSTSGDGESSSNAESPQCFVNTETTSEPPADAAPNRLVMRIEEIFTQVQMPEICNVPNLGQLYRMLLAYKRFIERRKFAHNGKDFKDFKQRLKKPRANCLSATLELFKNKEAHEIITTETVLIAELLMNFDVFQTLPLDQKWAVYKKFWARFLILDRLYRNYMTDFDDYQKQKAARDGRQYIELTSVGLQPTETDTKFEEMRMRTLVIPLARIQPNDIEFMSMVGNVLWSLDGRESVSTETLELAREQKARLFDELHSHYLGDHQHPPMYLATPDPPNYAIRIAIMCDIVHTLDKFINKKKEDIDVLRIFDAINISSSTAELLGLFE